MHLRGTLCTIALLAVMAPRAVAAPRAVCSASGVLPAGLYFRLGGNYVGSLAATERCPRATAAVVLGIYGRAADAAARMRALPAGTLTPGYPWAVHSEELGIADHHHDGVVVVAGLFADVRVAHAWLAHAAAALHGARVVALASDKATLESAPAGGAHRVVEIAARHAVAAYRGKDIAALGVPKAWGGAGLPAKAARGLTRVKPLCTVHPGDVFVVEDPTPLGGLGLLWVAVRCGKTVAYVRTTATRFETVVWRDRAGHYRLSQIGRVECDVPTMFIEWRYRGPGRRSSPRKAPNGGCG